uniref:Pc75, similar to salivary protein MYS3 n=1 Tax=Panstrongylus chinai TaxID=156444 RepID=A0A286T376_9HEMI|nr:Pc75, similar to salivary protein MYS3 [Panstrongylus chinai]
MKLLLIFSVSFTFGLVQNVGARPYPQDSTAWSYLGSWFSNDGNINYRSNIPSAISNEGANLLSQGTDIANQLIGSVSDYGKMGMEMAQNLGKTAMDAVDTIDINNLAEMGTNAVSSIANSGLTLGQELIACGTETITTGIDAVAAIINQVIQGITNLVSAFG